MALNMSEAFGGKLLDGDVKVGHSRWFHAAKS
jgi:hypothetical protein